MCISNTLAIVCVSCVVKRRSPGVTLNKCNAEQTKCTLLTLYAFEMLAKANNRN